MSYGLRVKNATGNVIISDVTINPLYNGEAAFQSEIAPAFVPNEAGNELEYQFSLWRLRYRINTTQQIFPFVSANDGYTFCLYSINDGGTYKDIYIYSSARASVAGIRVFCFSPIPDGATATGFGLNIYGPTGQLRFSSTFNNLAPVGATAVNTSAISFRGGVELYTMVNGQLVPSGVYQYLYYPAVTGSNVAYYALNVASISTPIVSGYSFSGRPAVFFSQARRAVVRYTHKYSHQYAIREDGFYNVCSFSGNNLINTWVKGLTYEAEDDAYDVSGSANVTQPAQSDFVLVIDTAHYD